MAEVPVDLRFALVSRDVSEAIELGMRSIGRAAVELGVAEAQLRESR